MTIKQTGLTSEGNILTTEMNALADNGITAVGTEFDNSGSADRHTYGYLELNLASLTPTGTPYVIIYMVKALDGTNYEDSPAAGGANSNTEKLTIPVSTGVGTKLVMSKRFTLPDCKVKFLLENQLNVAMGASGNTLELFTTNLVNV